MIIGPAVITWTAPTLSTGVPAVLVISDAPAVLLVLDDKVAVDLAVSETQL